MKPPGTVRVVVTGLGAVSGYGWGVEALWAGLLSGEPAIGAVSRFDARRHRTQIAAEVPARASGSSRRDMRSLSDEYALASAREALAHAGLGEDFARATDGGRGRRVAVLFGSSTGGMLEAESFYADATRAAGRERRASLHDLVSHPTSGPADAVARAFSCHGPVRTLSSACASASLALGEGLDALRDGEVDLVLAGGSDSLCQLTYAGFNSLRAVDERPCRPFRGDRQGLTLGEGAAVLVLERAADAALRGAPALAELVGFGATCDAHHMTAPDPSGSGVARAIRQALGEAEVALDGVAFVNAHGTGTPLNDAAEWAALRAVFGERVSSLPVTSNKGAVGHFLGSAGAVEAVVTVRSLLERRVPVTPGDGDVDVDAPVWLVRERPFEIDRGSDHGLSTNFAFGGSNAALVFRAGP
jgi:3-oxoacyl-[acyl-carrier-protein] synthase II